MNRAQPSAAGIWSSLVQEGLGGWTFSQFDRAMRGGKRPDGTGLRPPMSDVSVSARRMTETEMQALWSYLRSVSAVADRE